MLYYSLLDPISEALNSRNVTLLPRGFAESSRRNCDHQSYEARTPPAARCLRSYCESKHLRLLFVQLDLSVWTTSPTHLFVYCAIDYFHFVN